MSRQTALKVLTAVRTRGAWADAALPAQLRQAGLDRKDASLCSRIVYGVLQNQLLLDFYLESFCTQPLDHLQPPLADILRIGAYQILYLDKVPDSAAVNSAVELAKTSGRSRASGLVNAVLRNLARNKDALPAVPEEDPVKALSICTSHPRWLVKRLLGLLGQEEAQILLEADNAPAPLTAQVNTLRFTPDHVRAELEAEGAAAAALPWLPDCLTISGAGDLEKLSSFRAGAFYVQDPAARMAVFAAGVRPGAHVLDVCAAPGGKSFAAAIQMENRGAVLSCDLHGNKLKRVREGAERLGITCIETAATDGRKFHPAWEGAFDAVLVDAPCSGLGIIRKKPDVRYKSLDSLLAMPVIQRGILDNAARYVKPGGTLLYSTCMILPEENQEVTDGFLAEYPEFSRAPFSLPLPGTEEAETGQVTLWPHRHGTDGFYICRMTRRP